MNTKAVVTLLGVGLVALAGVVVLNPEWASTGGVAEARTPRQRFETSRLANAMALSAEAKGKADAQNAVPRPVIEISLGRHLFQAEVALSEEAMARGLMYRTYLAPDAGMLFPFKPAQRVRFWMKNCKISLDMVFLREGKVLQVTHSATPCVTQTCTIYPSQKKVDLVLELAGGTAKRLGIRTGDRLNIKGASLAPFLSLVKDAHEAERLQVLEASH